MKKKSAKSSRESTRDPVVHSRNIQGMLSDVIAHLKKDSARVKEPRFKALLKVSGRLLGGMRTAFKHYDREARA